MSADPMFYVRLCSDGTYEGPIHASRIERVRVESGAWRPLYLAAVPAAPAAEPVALTDEQALELARKHLDKGLSWAPHITRCTDLEIKALIRAVERAHGIGAPHD